MKQSEAGGQCVVEVRQLERSDWRFKRGRKDVRPHEEARQHSFRKSCGACRDEGLQDNARILVRFGVYSDCISCVCEGKWK